MPRLSLRADAGVGAIAVSPTSRDAVLAGRSGLYIVDLQDPFALPRWLPLRSAWEISSVRWCPHPQRPAWVVSSSNQKGLVWNLELPSDRAVEHILHGHRRAVTEIDFSPHHSEQLLTASIDSTIRIWDVRQMGASAMTFADFDAGAIQARWSTLDENQVASAHDNRFVLWDRRRANYPVANVQAHQGECNGLQFLANGRLLTCSTDRTIKTWDLRDISSGSGPNRTTVTRATPELKIEAGFPVWRALPTPYELGALVVPLRGGNNSVTLANLARQTGTKSLDDISIGHRKLVHPDIVRDAVFMRSDQSIAHYDIVTWCQDSHLRDWDGSILQELPHASSAAGCKDDEVAPIPTDTRTYNTDDFDNWDSLAVNSHDILDLATLNHRNHEETHAIGHLDWIAGVRLSQDNVDHSLAAKRGRKALGNSPQDMATFTEQLSKEIISVSSRFPKVTFDYINIGAGVCDFTLNGPWGPDQTVVMGRFNCQVPYGYPYQPLKISVVDGSNMRDSASSEIAQMLEEMSSELSRHGVYALEFTVRYLVGDPVSLEDYLASETPSFDQLNGVDRIPSNSEDEDDDVDGDFITFEDEDQKHIFDDNLSLSGSESGDGAAEDSFGDESSSSAGMDSDSNYGTAGVRRFPLHEVKRDDIIDSTPVPKNCGALWSPTGRLVCFFNRRATGKEKGPLPLDKVFADDSRSDDSSAPFISDSEDFEQEISKNIFHTATNWSVTAAQLTANPVLSANNAQSNAAAAILMNANGPRNRSKTVTSKASDDRSMSPRQSVSPTSTHTIVVKNLLDLWPCRPDVAAEYRIYIAGDPVEIVEHNARVAAKYKLWEDENIWRLLKSYIAVEEAECLNPHSVMINEEVKFDWCGGSTGLRSLMPTIAEYLEQQGKIQLLACISLVFSSLRGWRGHLRRMTELTQPRPNPVAVMDSQTKAVFQATQDGFFHRVSDHHRGDAFQSDARDLTPLGTERTSLSPKQPDTYWLDPELSSVSVAGDSPDTHPRRQSVQPSPSPLHHPDRQKSPFKGPMIGIEIDSQVFEFDHPPSSYIVINQKSNADEDFVRWLPRLFAYRLYYASLLQIWGLNVKRAEVVKLNPYDSLVYHRCQHLLRIHDDWIEIDVSPNTSCALCSSPITRLFEYCDKCSHVLHRECAAEWWQTENECPSACGCDCKLHVG